MPKQILFIPTIVSTVIAVSSEQTNYPKENILVPESPYDYWKTNVVTDSYIDIDFGAPTTITGMGLFNTNYTNYIVRGSDSSTFASVPVDSGTITMRQCPNRLRYNNYQDPQTYGTPFAHRYLRLFIPAQTPTDAASIFKTGGVAFSTGVNELIFNPDLGFNVTYSRDVNQIQKQGGGAPETRIKGERYSTIQFTTRRFSNNLVQVEELASKLLSTDQGDTVIFFDNGEWNTYLTDSPFLFCCRRVGDPTVTYNEGVRLDIDNIIYIENL